MVFVLFGGRENNKNPVISKLKTAPLKWLHIQ